MECCCVKITIVFSQKTLVFTCFWTFHKGILSSITKHVIFGYSAYTISLFVCLRDYFFIMPARRTGNETPKKKNEVCEDLLFSTWCVTDRRGLYIHNQGHQPFTAETQKGELIKMGTIVDVHFSTVYPVQGEKCDVFKLMLNIPAWEDEDETWKTYVVREIDFRNFADNVFRHEHLLHPEDNGCSNVDKQLLDDWAAGVGGTKGAWFKNWYNKKMENLEASVPRNRLVKHVMPSVFGGQAAATSTTLPIANTIQQPPSIPTSTMVLPSFHRVPSHLAAQSRSKFVYVVLCLLY